MRWRIVRPKVKTTGTLYGFKFVDGVSDDHISYAEIKRLKAIGNHDFRPAEDATCPNCKALQKELDELKSKKGKK